MEACEFWSALSDDNDAHVVLQSHLGTLIPSLISRLQLKEEQILQERIEEEAHASGEKEINFKPIHRRYVRTTSVIILQFLSVFMIWEVMEPAPCLV